MPAVPNALLGFLIGQIVLQAQVDSVWWPYFFTADSLKSKVVASTRVDSETFYRLLANSPSRFDYFNLAIVVLVLVSLVGGIIQHPAKKVANGISTFFFSLAIIIHLIFARGYISEFQTKSFLTAEAQAQKLSSISFFNLIVLVLVTLTAVIQISADEQEEDRALKSKKRN